jgi:thiazole/oxazole-forming peptide maturase SagD family component
MMTEDIDPLLLRLTGPRLSPIHMCSRNRFDGLETLAVFHSQISNVRLLGGEFVTPSVSAGQSCESHRALSGALGEALERHGATCRPYKSEWLHGRYSELKRRYPLFPIEDTELFSSEKIVSPGFDLRNVGPDDEVEWISGRLLKNDEESDIYFPYPRAALSHKTSFPFDLATTNGLALGSSYEQALRTALCEFLERSAFLQAWWLKKSPPVFTAQDCLELPSEFIRLCAQWLKNRLWVLDLSETWGVPTFACLIRGMGQSEPLFTVSAAAHPNAQMAFRNAFQETARIFFERAQFLNPETKIPAAPYDQSVRNFDDIDNLYSAEETRGWTEFLSAGDRPGAKALKTRLASRLVSPEEEVLRRGGRILIFDLTPIDLALADLSLVRVIVPEGIPLNCAHRARPWGCPALRSYSVADLNPLPHPFL